MRGLAYVAGASLPKWRAESSLEFTDANGVQTAILSQFFPGYISVTSQRTQVKRKGDAPVLRIKLRQRAAGAG